MKTSDWKAGRSYPSWDAIRAHGKAHRRGFETGRNSAGGKSAARDWVCEHCGRGFRAQPVSDRRGRYLPRRFCSSRCMNAGLAAERMARKIAAQPAEAGHPLQFTARPEAGSTPDLKQALDLRAKALGLIRVHLPLAHKMVMGEADDWAPTRARVFIELLDRVLPDAA